MNTVFFFAFFLLGFVKSQNVSDTCTTWDDNFLSQAPCAVNIECDNVTMSMTVQFKAIDYPMVANRSIAYCIVNGSKVLFEEDNSGNTTTWTINNLDSNQTMDDENELLFTVPCQILYAGEEFSFYKDVNFTAQCVQLTENSTFTLDLDLDITDDDKGDIGKFGDVLTTDATAHMSICPKNETEMNCTMHADVTVGEEVCLVIWAEEGIEDIQIVEMTFSTASGNPKLEIYKSCSRSSDLIVDSIFEPEPVFNDTCTHDKIENCPRQRTQCFRVFRFQDTNSMKIEAKIKKSNALNVQASCASRRKRDINSNDNDDVEEEEEITISVNIRFNEDLIEMIERYKEDFEEIKSPLTEAALIGILAGSGSFIMVVAFLVYFFRFRIAQVAALDTRKVVA